MIRTTKLSFSNISTAILLVFSLLIVFNPDAKAAVIRGLMQIGLFRPDLSSEGKNNQGTTDGISFKDGKGSIVNLSDLQGKVLFINFWATWCPPCRAEMPSINKLFIDFKNNRNIVFLMVDVDDDYKKAAKYMNRKQFALPLYTPASSIPETLLSGSIPTTLIFDKKGQLVFKHEGAGDFSGKKVKDYLNMLSNELYL